MKNFKIGIPKALIFHEYYDIWINYFKLIGAEVVTSEDTNRIMIDKGIENSNSEYCLPLKAFMGHVESLIDKVDYIFVPRYTSVDSNEFTCPKFCALPDLVKLDMKSPVKILEADINLHFRPQNLLNTLVEMSGELGVSSFTSICAFKKAAEEINRLESTFHSNNKIRHLNINENKLKPIGVFGHSYMLNDKYLNMNLMKKVLDFGYEITTPKDVEKTNLKIHAKPYNKDNFWSVGIENLGAAFYFAENNLISGGIYITPFACGIDSIVAEIIEMRYAKEYRIPFLKLTIDEHSGEAGFDTRLEAFFDNISVERNTVIADLENNDLPISV